MCQNTGIAVKEHGMVQVSRIGYTYFITNSKGKKCKQKCHTRTVSNTDENGHSCRWNKMFYLNTLVNLSVSMKKNGKNDWTKLIE